ncbi:MAG TPA: hypothetical protein VL285_25015, partial [Bryobacteraceae bacterium]|nr:hypothetical protein [Bryobacteraceae bacterium]
SGENEVLLDGVSDVAGDRQVKHIPNIETIEEFRVITNPYDAQYGRTGGGAISITTRSGANQPHGVVWNYHRNSYATANSWSSNRLGLPISKRLDSRSTFANTSCWLRRRKWDWMSSLKWGPRPKA